MQLFYLIIQLISATNCAHLIIQLPPGCSEVYEEVEDECFDEFSQSYGKYYLYYCKCKEDPKICFPSDNTWIRYFIHTC